MKAIENVLVFLLLPLLSCSTWRSLKSAKISSSVNGSVIKTSLPTSYRISSANVTKSLRVTFATERKLLKIFHLRHSLGIFYFVEQLCFVLKIFFKFLIFLTIPWFTKSVTSWWVLVYETGCIFKYIFIHPIICGFNKKNKNNDI